MRIAGYILIVLGVASLAAHLFGVSFLNGGLLLASVLGAPILGGLLLFIHRFLGQPPGIDNNHIFQRSLSARGVVGLLVAVALTGLYVVIYLGEELRIGAPTEARLELDRDGTILSATGALAPELAHFCEGCTGERWWEQTRYDRLFVHNSGFGQTVAAFLESPRENATGSFWGSYVYRVSATAGTENRAIVRIQRQDTAHHFFSRNVYPLLDPASGVISGKPADRWFFYGSLYTIAVLLFGVRMLLKYRHSRYQMIRTASVMFFQLGFAYMIPNLLKLFKQPEFYFSYFWPLKPEYLYPSTWIGFLDQAGPGVYFVCFAAGMTFIATPTLTFFFGKRWYCSWVCGCGGLAETMGDPFRQLSDKSLKAWQAERWIIHGVLVLITLVTLLLWTNSLLGGELLGRLSDSFSKAYGLYIGAIFSGVIGVGFYPIMGSRVWCRFGCPMAAILGILQKWFSRFRITTNGGQCISCGNCSTYCEMGIDVRWYAQRGQNIIRASCVGCGICSAVCPRGVLNLENGSVFDRYNTPGATVLR
ncbi:MAG: 4Fe-4S binding protein [Spirochaetales bacterium]|nr:4Fe-4S binding protein [Leptospiraceae bacterium]MCP5481695.1 4Fe-4S binding protein [Spirochaetales bacterium]